jgi:hypothetical protein
VAGKLNDLCSSSGNTTLSFIIAAAFGFVDMIIQRQGDILLPYVARDMNVVSVKLRMAK